MMHKAWCSTEEVPLCFSRWSIRFEDYMDQKIDDLNPILRKIIRLVAAIKSLRFALLIHENTFENVVCEMAAILSRGRGVNAYICVSEPCYDLFR